ncbi:TonB-dependent receptor plug [Desulfarculus baarsii DSM 2075]|uniref:TonB-dependent receptor plug n=1 Tax=Desulfarculus baarsii (strain ATCC 33931 / DSM 2075 / LMG 7858 / VKM B-1802 / 2st14) TaxID=644282 RepID=E1QHJ6_DESB2|nr:TonB-dependent receptor [Desulfarculus baarsii]ADK85039.1 TonB-dependent receptor plug [Desulfarculus baarsii DSM 2075]
MEKRGRGFIAAVALVAALALGCPPAWAADDGQSAKRNWEADKTEMSDITVTATKTDVKADLSPVDAYSVDRVDIDFQPNYYMNNFGELIRDIPGVHVAQYYPWGPPWVHLRGTGHFLQRTVYLIDGVPAHHFMSAAINPNDIERVDVVLGPSSALYGASAAGGAVNIITRSGHEGMGAVAKMSYGSMNTFRPYTAVGDRDGKFNYYFSYSGDYSDGFQMKPLDGMVDLFNRGQKQYVRQASLENNKYNYTYLTGKAGWEADNGMGLTVAINYQQRYLYGGQSNYIINDNGDTVVNSVRFVSPLSDWGKLTATTGYQFQSIPSQETTGLSLVNGRVVLNDTITQTTTWDRQRLPLELQTDFYLGENNVLTTGASLAQEKEKTRYYQGTSSNQTYRSDITTDMAAVYMQDQQFLLDDKLSILAGVRYDYWRYHDIYDSGSSDKEPGAVSKDHVTYRGGVKYRFNDTIAVRANAGTAYWPGNAKWYFQNQNVGATQREANPNLEPEQTWMVDLGTDVTLNQWKTLFKATTYYGKIKDIMAYSYDQHPTLPNTILIHTRNIGEAEIYGLELSLDQPITEHFLFFAAATLNHSRITKDDVNPQNVGNQLLNSPDYWGSVGLRYANAAVLNGEVVFRYSGDRYYTDNNEDLPYFHMDAYQTVDAKIWRDWRLDKNWALSACLSAVNIFNERYATEIVYVNQGFYMEGMIGLRYTW